MTMTMTRMAGSPRAPFSVTMAAAVAVAVACVMGMRHLGADAATEDCGCSSLPGGCMAGPVFTFNSSDSSFTGKSDSPTVGSGTLDNEMTADQGAVGVGPGGSLVVAPIACLDVTPASFIVNPCGVVAPHNHANANEVNTVIQGEGVICVQPIDAATSSKEGLPIMCASVKEGDSFMFPKGSYHHWMSTASNTSFATVSTFTAAPPDAALLMTDPTGSDDLSQCEGVGMIGTIESDAGGSLKDGSGSDASPMLDALLGTWGAPAPNPGFPLFPSFGNGGGACDSAVDDAKKVATSGQAVGQLVSPVKLASKEELTSGTYSIGQDGVGGIIRLVTDQDWTWLAEEAQMSLALYVFSYCGMLNMHLHGESDEWGTVIGGSGYVFQYGPNTPGNVTAVNVSEGDVYYVPAGNTHWFVNGSPDEQFVTIAGWSEPKLELSFFINYANGVEQQMPDVLDLTLGKGFTASSADDVLFPMLTTAKPSGCGGDKPCNTCGDTSFLDDFVSSS